MVFSIIFAREAVLAVGVVHNSMASQLKSSQNLTSRNKLHVIYVTWVGGIYLICTHKPEGVLCPRVSVDISDKFRLHILHMLCNTSGTLRNLPFTVLPLYIMMGTVNGYGFLILMFL